MSDTERPLNGADSTEYVTPPDADNENLAGDGGAAEQTTTEEQGQPRGMIEQLEQERARAADYLEQAQRARAELINYRRRTEQEMQQIRQFAAEHIISRLLPVLDDFHRAIQAVPQDEHDTPWVQGILMIERKLWSILEAEGVRPIDAVGQRFDPSRHEAVMVDETATQPDTVVQEFQRGYLLHDRVVRPAMVKVGTSNDGQDHQTH